MLYNLPVRLTHVRIRIQRNIVYVRLQHFTQSPISLATQKIAKRSALKRVKLWHM